MQKKYYTKRSFPSADILNLYFVSFMILSSSKRFPLLRVTKQSRPHVNFCIMFILVSPSLSNHAHNGHRKRGRFLDLLPMLSLLQVQVVPAKSSKVVVLSIITLALKKFVCVRLQFYDKVRKQNAFKSKIYWIKRHNNDLNF